MQLVGYSGFDVVKDNEDILWFQVGMDDTAAPVHVVQAQEELFRDLADQATRYALRLIALDKPKQVFAENLEDHADVGSMRSNVHEVVQEGDDVRPSGMGIRGRRVARSPRCMGGDDPLEELYLVLSCLGILWCRFDNLECDMCVCSNLQSVPIFE